MSGYYDDDFGHWDIEDEDDIEFYNTVQRKSVWKTCQGCGQRVKIMPDYAYCDSCASILERGGDLY